MHLLVGILITALAVLLAVSFGVIDALHVQPRPRAGQKRVACVGDSITYGCFVPGQPWNSYPRQLGRMLGRGYCVGNFGYTNRTALKSGDYPYTAEKLYRRSLAFQPELVLLMLGTNDTKAEEKNVPIIDIHSAFVGKKELFMDGCHPNAKGASLIAEKTHAAADRQ